MSEIQLDKLTKIFADGTVAVLDLDLEIQDGEFMVFVGPSGCGKTTALRMIAGLEDITRGTVSIGGRIVNDAAPKDRDVAMVFVGPSGCGKTTALRMIAGLEDITRGTVSIGGRIVNDAAPKDRDVAM